MKTSGNMIDFGSILGAVNGMVEGENAKKPMLGTQLQADSSVGFDPNVVNGKNVAGKSKPAVDGVGKGIDSAMQVFSTAAPMIGDISKGKNERMNERGVTTHKANVGGKALSMAATGAQIAGPWGALVGGAVGAGLGFLDKSKQPSQADEMRQNDKFNMGLHTKTLISNDTLPEQVQSAKYGMKYADGTKLIEVEKDEVVLRKVGKAFKKVADFKGGKTHNQGGEPYIAEEGDIIVPGKKRLLVDQALRTRNWTRLESIRQSLPTDKAPQNAYPNGTDGVDTKPKPNPYSKIHLPRNADPLRQQELQLAYASAKKLSTDQLEGFRNQQTSDSTYYANKQKHISDYTTKWMGEQTNHTPNSQLSQTTPEYKAMAEAREKTWYANNKREINPVVQNYYKTGPAGFNANQNIRPDMNLQGPSGMLASTEVPEYEDGTSGVKTNNSFGKSVEDIKAYIYKKLVDAGLNSNAAKGFVVNLSYETGNFKNLEEVGTNKHGTKGLGIAQWTDSTETKRRTAFESYLEKNGTDVNDLEANVGFLISELKGEQGYNVGTDIKTINKNSTTVEKAAKHILTDYERPADQSDEHLNKRLELSKAFIDSDVPVTTLSDVPELRANQERMMAENKKKLGYVPYSDYVRNENVAGNIPESEEWYKQNVVEPIKEKNRGYWTIDSPTGRKNYESGNIVRKGINLDPKSMSNEEKLDILKKAQKDGLYNGPIVNLKELNSDKTIFRDINKAVSELPKRWLASVEDNLKDDYHQIKDPKLKKEALAFENYLEANKDNGTWAGRKGAQLFNFLDQAITTGLSGVGWNDDSQVSTNIWNLLAGESPETVEKIINDAKSAGVLSEKGANYAWHVMSDPEVFKNQEAEAVEDINVALFAKDAPRAAIRAGRGLKNIFKGTKNIATYIKNGGLTPAGIKYLRNSGAFKMQVKAAENAKNSKPAEDLANTLESVYGNTVNLKGTESLDELEALAKTVDAQLPVSDSGFNWYETKKFFTGAVNTIKNLPKSMHKTLYGKSYKEIMGMENDLAKIVGKDVSELRKMNQGDIVKAVVSKRKDKFTTLENAIKAKEEAWKSYKEVKDKAIKAQAVLDGAKVKGLPSDIAAAQEELDVANDAIKGLTTQIEELETLTKTNWDQIGKIEAWEMSEGVNDDWRRLVQGEKAIAKHVDNIKDLDESLIGIKEEQSAWAGLKADTTEGLNTIIGQKNTALSEARNVTLAQGRAQKDVNAFEILGQKAPKLAADLAENKELVKEINASARTVAEAYNIIRKKGIPLSKEAEDEAAEFSEEDITKAGTPREAVAPGVDAGLETKGVVPLSGGSTVEDINTDVPKIDIPKIGEKASDKKGLGLKIGGGLETLAGYAPAIYNIMRGLEKPEEIRRRFVRPQTMQYENMSQPQLNAIDTAFNASLSNARNNSGGLMANFRSNTEAAWADRIARTAQVNQQEVARSYDIANQNVGIRNQAEQINTQTNQQADIMDLQSEAATKSFLGQGMQDVANIASRNKRDRMAQSNQDIMLQAVNSGRNFSIGQDGTIAFNGVLPTPSILTEDEQPKIGG